MTPFAVFFLRRDVGTERALAALAREVIPTDSAAKMAVAEIPTEPMPAIELDQP